jgi:hypothetical protein
MRETLKAIGLSFIVVGLAVVMVGFIVFGNQLARSAEVVYNCNVLIGSWHPDVPKQVIEECRKIKHEKDLL